MSDLALALRAIHKRFGVTDALTDVTLEVRRGTLHAVLGENGAGKSTLMHIAYGMLRADAGELDVDGAPVILHSSRDARAHGLGMVHQHFALVPAMTVAENIALGGTGRFDPHDIAERVAEASRASGLMIDPAARVATLGVGAQQRVELLKALVGSARTLILDEPTAVLTPAETEELHAWLRRFVATGHTVILITHKLHEAMALADDVTVLRRGRRVLTARTDTLTTTDLVRAVTGDEPDAPAVRTAGVRGRVVASLHDVTAHDGRGVPRVRDVSLTLNAGEVVGVAGVEGSGVHELLRVLAGRLMPTGGTIALPSSIAFIPEDRQRDALIGEFTLTENVALRGAASRRGVMPWGAARAATVHLLQEHDVRARAPEMPARELSGGNQQKFVVGRELAEHPALVVAENPVRGLDIKATAHVLRSLQARAQVGASGEDAGCVVVYSSDVDDVLPIADRMLVMFDGRVHEVPATRDAVARALVGVA